MTAKAPAADGSAPDQEHHRRISDAARAPRSTRSTSQSTRTSWPLSGAGWADLASGLMRLLAGRRTNRWQQTRQGSTNSTRWVRHALPSGDGGLAKREDVGDEQEEGDRRCRQHRLAEPAANRDRYKPVIRKLTTGVASTSMAPERWSVPLWGVNRPMTMRLTGAKPARSQWAFRAAGLLLDSVLGGLDDGSIT
jgi:hypothetical protein